MFFGPSITRVFASRWQALAWSAGVLLTAWCSVPSDDQDAATSATANPTADTIAALIGASAPAQPDGHGSPWALDSSRPTTSR